MELRSSIEQPDATKAITAIKRQMRARWSRSFAAFQAYTSKDTDQIVDDVVLDICRDVIKWDYGGLEAVLAFWSHRRILGELKNAALRRKKAKLLRLGLGETGEDQPEMKLDVTKLWWVLGSPLPAPGEALTRQAVMQLCEGRVLETQLAQMVLEDPGLIGDKNFNAQDIHEEFRDRGVALEIEEIYALIQRFRKLLKPLVPRK